MRKVSKWSFKNVKKGKLEDEYTILTIQCGRDTLEFKIDNIRHFTQDADEVANYKEIITNK